jgi:predicted PurR-regulated permease PerM
VKRWMRWAVVVLVLALVAWAILRLGDVLTPFAIAFALAYILNPLANGLERLYGRLARRLRFVGPRTAAVGTLCVVAVGVAAAIALVVIPTVVHQVTETAAKVPGYAETLRARLDPLIQRLNLRYPEELAEVRSRLAEAARTQLPQMVAPTTRIVAFAFSSVLSFVLTLLNLVIIPVFAIYLLFDMNRIQAGLAELVPHRFRGYVYSRARAVDALLAGFVRGQLTVCLILGVFYAIALSSCGVPMGIPVGLLIGSFNVIPFMSAGLGLPLALLLSWVDAQNWQRLVAVAIVFVFGQFVEGNFITPRIVGERLGLHAVVIMLAVLVGGTVFGFVGMILAVPVTAALSVFFADLRRFYLESDFFAGDQQTPPAPEA